MNFMSDIRPTPRKRGRPKVTPEYLAEKEAEKEIEAQSAKKARERLVNVVVHRRFFQALDHLIERGIVQSFYEFAKTYNINPSNFYQLQKNPQDRTLPISYLFFLVQDYGVDGNWMFTGQGDMMRS